MLVILKIPAKLGNDRIARQLLTADSDSRLNLTDIPQACPASLGVLIMAVAIPLFLKKFEKSKVSARERNTQIPNCIYASVNAHIALVNTIFISEKESVSKDDLFR